MLRFTRVFVVVTVMLFGLAIGSWTAAGSRAQEATPGAEMMPQGVTFAPLGFASGVTLPSPADIFVSRVTLDPGAGFSFDPNDPEGGVLVVQSGTFTVRVEAAWTVTRAAGLNEAMATAEATGDVSGMIAAVAASEEATLETGDVAYIPGSVAGEMRNDGTEPAVALGVLIGPSQPMAEGTPTS